MIYKSSFSKVFISFVKTTVSISFIVIVLFGALLLLLERLGEGGYYMVRDTLSTAIYAIAVLSAAVAAYLAFCRHNITIEVNADAIRFLRGKKEYQYFPFAGFTFTSQVSKYSYNLISVSTSRCVRVTSMINGKIKDHQCYCFSPKTFEELMTHIRTLSAVYAPAPDSQAGQVLVAQASPSLPTPRVASLASGEPLVFHIDKELLVGMYKKSYLSQLITLCAVILIVLAIHLYLNPQSFTDHFLISVMIYVFLAVIMLPIPLITLGVPLAKIKKSAPKLITLFPDRITLDERTFFFSEIKQIKVTPPTYHAGDRILRRTVTIIEDKGVSKFIVGDTRDMHPTTIKKGKPKVFAEYGLFCFMLEKVLKEHLGKFVLELK